MKDTLQRFIFKDKGIRGELVRLDKSLMTIMGQHSYPVPVRKLLAQTLCSSVLLSATLKYEGQLTIQFQNDGILNMLVAKCDNQHRIRATAQWDAAGDFKKIESEFAAGKLVITILDETSGKHYQSIVDIHRQSIASALEGYFMQSEQLSTKLWMGYRQNSAVGLLLQKLPSDSAEEAIAWEHITTLANTVQSHELLTWDNSTLLNKLFHEEDIVLYEPKPVVFHCTCNTNKMLESVRLLGEAEAMDILKTHRFVEVTCEYCNHHFEFDANDVKALFTRH